MKDRIIVKFAETEEEFRQVHKLNYETFVEEIPQHSENQTKILVDKLHEKNKYIVALFQDEVVGMVAINDLRPFSLDAKIPEIEKHLPPFDKALEIRLLSVKPTKRGGRVFFMLAQKIVEWGHQMNFNLVLISGTTRQIKLYEKIGFTGFYKLLGKDDALYQPMYLDVNKFIETYGEKFLAD
ncbi:MAG: GNAT family N-acetyltransferase [Bacteroidia bacterium]